MHTQNIISCNLAKQNVKTFTNSFTIQVCENLKPLTDVARDLLVIDLRLTCDWTFEIIAMACNRSLNMLNIFPAIL